MGRWTWLFSTFVSMKPLTESSGHFSAGLWQLNQIFLTWPWDTSSCILVNKTRYFKPKHNLFLTLTKCFLCLNLTRLNKITYPTFIQLNKVVALNGFPTGTFPSLCLVECFGSLSCWKTNEDPLKPQTRWDGMSLQNAVVALNLRYNAKCVTESS